MKTLPIAIPAGGQVTQDGFPGTVFVVKDLGGAPSIDVTFRYRGAVVGTVPAMTRGRARGDYDGFTLKNNGAADATVTVVVLQAGDLDIAFTDGLVIANSAADPVKAEIVNPLNLTATDVGIFSPDTLATVADVAIGAAVAAQLVAAAGAGVKHREIIVKNLFANPALIRVGDAAVAAARGHELMPGESITLDTLAAVHAFNTGAAGQSVSVVINQR